MASGGPQNPTETQPLALRELRSSADPRPSPPPQDAPRPERPVPGPRGESKKRHTSTRVRHKSKTEPKITYDICMLLQRYTSRYTAQPALAPCRRVVRDIPARSIRSPTPWRTNLGTSNSKPCTKLTPHFIAPPAATVHRISCDICAREAPPPTRVSPVSPGRDDLRRGRGLDLFCVPEGCLLPELGALLLCDTRLVALLLREE